MTTTTATLTEAQIDAVRADIRAGTARAMASYASSSYSGDPQVAANIQHAEERALPRLQHQDEQAHRMKTTTLLLLASLATAAAQPVTVPFLGALGVPLSDRDLLTARHVAAGSGLHYDAHPTADLAVVHYAPGTFARWAEVSYDTPALGDTLLVAVRGPAGVAYDHQTVSGFLGVNLVRTEPLLRGGDSGGGVFDSAGRLVAVNVAVDSRQNSYHAMTGPSRLWIEASVTQVPEPSTWALLLSGAALWLWRSRRTS